MKVRAGPTRARSGRRRSRTRPRCRATPSATTAATGPTPGAVSRERRSRATGDQQHGARDHHPGGDRRSAAPPASRCLAMNAADRVAEARRAGSRRAAEELAAASRRGRRPSRTATPATPSDDRRPAAAPCERSSWSIQIASSAVNSGAEATRIPASDEEISCSPAAISRNGPADLHGAEHAPGSTARPGSPRSAPRSCGERRRGRARASAIRSQATIAGREVAEPDLDEHVAGAPDRAQQAEQHVQARRSIPSRVGARRRCAIAADRRSRRCGPGYRAAVRLGGAWMRETWQGDSRWRMAVARRAASARALLARSSSRAPRPAARRPRRPIS